MTAAEFADCNDCGQGVDPNDAAPSCGSHALCVGCWQTGDFRCRECLNVARWIALDQKLSGRERSA